MTLGDLCEPMFVYMCRLNRLARKGGSLEIGLGSGECFVRLHWAKK